MAANRKRIALSLIFLPGLALLCLSSFHQSRALQYSHVSPHLAVAAPLALNWYADSQGEELERNAAELELTVEYMVWPRELQRARVELAKVYKQQLNQRPFSGVLWEKLLAVQMELPAQQAELSYTLSRLLEQLEWRTKSFRSLVYYCVHLDSKISQQTKLQCRQLFAQASKLRHVHDPKQLLGMTADEYQQLVDKARLKR